MLDKYWPLFGLRICTPRLVLRLPTDDDLVALAHLVEAGIHDPAVMPFDDPPWTDTPSPRREREFMQRQWAARALWDATSWRLRLMAEVDGCPIGMQDLLAEEFSALGVVVTYSWLAQREQGRGYGKEMRAAILHLAFEGLGARLATSAAFHDNQPSIGVSKALGYRENGRDLALRRGVPTEEIRFAISREEWLARRRTDIRIEGLEPCLPLFGLPASGT